jgi:2-polyprenyl-3-methyl-5-hydroxy-6-metoxy-1,4-benzoquinol methylase
MIDYLIVIYNNYDLLDLQVKNFKTRLPKKDYRLIVVDNTPNENKQTIDVDPIIDKLVLLDSVPTFDGVSHGHAINEGLKHCTSDIVGIIDSDFFFLSNNIHEYVFKKFAEGYQAVGCEYNDGKDTKAWVNINPKNFENIPCCFGAYYTRELATSQSWVITPEEVNTNKAEGFVEVGYRIRKHILDNNIKTLNWKTDSQNYGCCYFKNDDNEIMGIHYVAGSHRRWNESSKEEVSNIISVDHNNCEELTHCLCCNGTNLEKILDLNNQPLANSYLNYINEAEWVYPLAINYCHDCTHIQLTHSVNPDLLFKNYLYVSGTTKTLKDYFDWFVDFSKQYVDGKTVLDIACNDGTQLDSFKVKGYSTFGIDPAVNLYPLSSKNHNIVCDYLTEDSIGKLNTKFDIIIAQNVFAHNTYPKEFLEICKNNLSDNGRIFIQTSQANMVRNNEFDTIYHEHISFFSEKSFHALAKRAGLKLIDIQRTPVHGTSFVFVLGKESSEASYTPEEDLTYFKMLRYAKNCKEIAQATSDKILQLKRDGYKMIGYGAAAKGNTFLNFAKFNLDYIVDDNPLKQGLYSPGSKILIKHPDAILQEETKVCIVPLAWNFFDEIRTKVLNRKSKDVIFLRYFPEVKILEN